MDILKYVYDNLHLVLIGDGPERQALERFAHSIRVNDRVHFLGELDNASAILSQAQVVWVPSVARGGSNVALEAMAAGRPVVAGRVPELAEIVVDGETGFVVSSGDKVALARRTRMLLADSDLRERLGRAGQERARRDYSVAALVRAYAGFYQAAVA
jgi:glycosyltransferase involved in cell wall biosynthesis